MSVYYLKIIKMIFNEKFSYTNICFLRQIRLDFNSFIL